LNLTLIPQAGHYNFYRQEGGFYANIKYMSKKFLIFIPIVIVTGIVVCLTVFQPDEALTPSINSFKEFGNELEKTEKTLQTIKLYYYNPDLDKDETDNVLCSKKGLVAVERKIPVTKTPIQDAIKLLLLGELTSEEKDQGVTTEYPLTGLSLKGASLKEGILTLEFNDPNNKTVGGSCRIGILWFQIEATAKQFPQIQEVKFMSEELFQP